MNTFVLYKTNYQKMNDFPALPAYFESEAYSALEAHFTLLYELMVDCKYIPNAILETKNGVQRCLSGSLNAFDNAILKSTYSRVDWDKMINEQLNYFKNAKVPFSWHVESHRSTDLVHALERYEFKKVETIYCYAGNINQVTDDVVFPKGYIVEQAISDENFLELTQLVCRTFGYEKELEQNYNELFKIKSKGEKKPVWSHWIVKKNQTVVSAISTMIKDRIVSFWNAATVPEHQHMGLCKNLTKIALSNAADRGCRIAVAYLSEEKQALGVVNGFGGRHIYSFEVFFAPAISEKSD